MPKDLAFLSLINITIKHQQFALQILVIYKVLSVSDTKGCGWAGDFGHLHMAADLHCKFETSPLSSLHNMQY